RSENPASALYRAGVRLRLKPFVSMVMFATLSLPVAGASVPPIDTSNRSAVVQLFRNVYLPTVNVESGWTGSTASCSPGSHVGRVQGRHHHACELLPDHGRPSRHCGTERCRGFGI